jgi:hypothetical protein
LESIIERKKGKIMRSMDEIRVTESIILGRRETSWKKKGNKCYRSRSLDVRSNLHETDLSLLHKKSKSDPIFMEQIEVGGARCRILCGLPGHPPAWHYSATRRRHRSSMISGEDSWREVRKGKSSGGDNGRERGGEMENGTKWTCTCCFL